MKREMLRWHELPADGLPDADLTVECALLDDDEPTWPGYWTGTQWIDATSGAPFASRVVAWCDRPQGISRVLCRNRLLPLARRPGGVTNADVQAAIGCSATRAASMLARQVVSGKFFSAKAPKQTKRFFDCPLRAADWLAEQPTNPPPMPRASSQAKATAAPKAAKPAAAPKPPKPPKVKRAKKAKPVRISTLPGADQVVPSAPSVDAPVQLRRAAPKVEQPIVIPANVKRTTVAAPTYDARYQVDPASRPFGAGFAAVGVGRSVTDGGAWA